MTKLLRCLFLTVLLAGSFFQGVAQTSAPTSVIEHIKQLQATVENRRAYLTELQPGGNYLLPIGLLKQGDGGNKPAILIDEIELHSTYAQLKAYVAFNLPGNDDPIYFATVEPVRIGYSGGILGQAKLSLVEDRVIKMGSDDTKLTILGQRPGHQGSYVSFDCKGFSGARLEVEGALSSKLVKENADGTQNLNDRVKAFFTLEFSDLNDILASATIEPFQIRGVPRLSFEVQQAVVDLSDYKNEANMVFPAGYIDDYYPGTGLDKLWRGFYLKSLKVKLPQEIEDRSSNGARKEISLTNMLIDNHGFSGVVEAKNLITMENGNLSGWAYSIDDIALGFKANQLIEGKIAGGLVLPIAKESQALGYKGVVDQHMDYSFAVTLREDLEFDIFRAKQIVLKNNSSVTLTNIGGKFRAEALLHGSMQISASLTENTESSNANKFNISSIDFESLKISTISPYLHSGTFKFNTAIETTFGSYGFGISDLQLQITTGTAALSFTGAISFSNSNDANNGFSAQANLSLIGKVEVLPSGRHHYYYDKTQLNSAKLDIDQGTFSLKGEIDFYREDPTFGSGFKGVLAVKLPMDIKVSATAMFGHVNGFKYWYTDALADFPTGLPVIPPVLEINGFAGGLYYKVKQKKYSGQANPVVSSQTGLSYIPDATAGLGVRASVMFGLTKNKKLFNGDVGFEVAFYSGGGLQRAALMGNAYIMQELSSDVVNVIKRGAEIFSEALPGQDNFEVFASMKRDAAMSTTLLMQYVSADAANGTEAFLSVESKTNISVAGGLITGYVGGDAYFSKSNWHIYLGKPDPEHRINLNFANLFRADAYFMVGKIDGKYLNINVPQNVTNAIGGSYRGLSKSSGVLSRANGLAFGASLTAGPYDLNVLIFYAHLQAGVGFDIMLMDYGSSAQCEGRSGPIGINGWYARGSAWAYVEAEIGIRVRIFGRRKSFTILGLNAGALLQAALPNPTYFHGAVGGNYRILGGLVKGKCRFEFSIGEQCKVINSSDDLDTDIKIISEIIPSNGEEEVSVYATPKIVFDVPVNQIITGEEIPEDPNVDPKVLEFKVALDKVKTTAKIDNNIIDGTWEFNSSQTECIFTPTSVLPANKTITVTAEVQFLHKEGSNWYPYYVGYNNYKEIVVNTFKTGENPLAIPISNIAYSYPVLNQKYYYKDETKDGYIILTQKQDYLFEQNDKFSIGGVLKPVDGAEIPVQLSYNSSEKKISYTFPDIQVDKNYDFIIRGVLKNVSLTESDSDTEDKDDKFEVLRIPFRTSKYASLQAKLDACQRNYVSGVGVNLVSNEEFEDVELFSNNLLNLINVNADMQFIKNLDRPENLNIYHNYPIDESLLIPGRTVVNGMPDVQCFRVAKGTYTKAGLYAPVTYIPGDNRHIACYFDRSVLAAEYEDLRQRYTVFYFQNAGTNSVMYPNEICADYNLRMPACEEYPHGYPYFGENGQDSYLNYWSYGDEYSTTSYFHEHELDFPDDWVWDQDLGTAVYISRYERYRDFYINETQKYYRMEPDDQTIEKLHTLKDFVAFPFAYSSLSYYNPYEISFTYRLPGSNIVTSVNKIRFNETSN